MKEWEYAALVREASGESWSLNQKGGSYTIEIEIELSNPLEDVGSEWKNIDEGVYRLEVMKITWTGFDDFSVIDTRINGALSTGQDSVERTLGEDIVKRAELIESGNRPESLYTKSNLLDLVNLAGEDGWELMEDIGLQDGDDEVDETRRSIMRRDLT